MNEYPKTKSYLRELIPRTYLHRMYFDDLNKFEQEEALALFILESSERQLKDVAYENDCDFCSPDVLRLMAMAVSPINAKSSNHTADLTARLKEILLSMFVGTYDNPGRLGQLFIDLIIHHEIYNKLPRSKYEKENWPCY